MSFIFLLLLSCLLLLSPSLEDDCTGRAMPNVMVCTFSYQWTSADATITYDEITAANGDGEMDINTGVYTAIIKGHYTITFSGIADLDPSEHVVLSLYHNGEFVPESHWVSANDGSGHVFDQGSRTVVCKALLCTMCIVLYCTIH